MLRLTPTTPEGWRKQIAAERQRQAAKGFDADHDDAHGIRHFLEWSQDYSRRDSGLHAAALVEVALERLAVLRSYVEDPANWSALDVRRDYLLSLLDGSPKSSGSQEAP